MLTSIELPHCGLTIVVSDCKRELNDHLYRAASLWSHTQDTNSATVTLY